MKIKKNGEIIYLSESDLKKITNVVTNNKKISLNEAISLKGAKISPVPIDWNGPKGKYSGQIKIQYGEGVSYYKLTVVHFLYEGPILITKLWYDSDNGEYKVQDNTGKNFPVTKKQMEEIVEKGIEEIRSFTVKGDALLKLTKTA